MPVEVQSLAEWEAAGQPDMLSVVIPAHNEEGHIAETVRAFDDALSQAGIAHEILVINDNSQDGTEAILKALHAERPTVRYLNNPPPNGFGFAVRSGLAHFRGDAVAVVMADMSDLPQDLVAFYGKLQEGYDCVFGTRWSRSSRVVDYPWLKLLLNRSANTMIKWLFWFRYNDVTNAFKLYRRRVIAGVQPLLAYDFNLTVELPLKAIARGHRYAVLPNSWINRKEGVSKFHIREMSSQYLFIVLYCYLEKVLSRNNGASQEELQKNQLQVWPR